MRLDLLTGRWIEDKPKRSKTKRLPEASVGDHVDAYLKSLGFYMRVIKSDGQKLSSGRWIPSKQGRGISDRIGVTDTGRFIGVELKAEGKRKDLTDEQRDFLTRIIRNGGIGVVADSVESVKAALSMSKEELLDFLPKPKTEDYQSSLGSLFP